MKRLKNDPAIASLLNSLDGDNNALLASVSALLESRGIAAPWSVPKSVSVQDFLAQFLARKMRKLAPASYRLVLRVLKAFALKFKSMSMTDITGAHMQQWQDDLVASGLSSGSVVNQMACLSSVFARAVALGHIRSNPCAAVEPVDNEPVVHKEPMLDADFDRLLAWLRDRGEDEWVLVCTLCRHAGLRLGDAARLDCSAIRVEGGVTLLALTVAKTKKPSVVPCFDPLASVLRGFLGKAGAMCPELAKTSTSALSKQFSAFLRKSGVDAVPVHLPNGMVHCRVSAHSLRHAYVTDMVKRGVPTHLRMRLSAHSTVSSHAVYDHGTAVDLHNQVKRFF